MKATELMIGDWVNVSKLNKPVRVGAVYHTMIIPNPDDDNVHASIGDEYLEPISLTPEILEKNRFIKENESWWYKDFRIVLDNSKGESLICGRQVKFTYVHQLQHALRLCGIEKEIEL